MVDNYLHFHISELQEQLAMMTKVLAPLQITGTTSKDSIEDSPTKGKGEFIVYFD